MALPARLMQILRDLENRENKKTLTGNERTVLRELRAINRILRSDLIDVEMRGAFYESATKMTSPGGDSCGECGRPF
jgi:hypothetical protein